VGLIQRIRFLIDETSKRELEAGAADAGKQAGTAFRKGMSPAEAEKLAKEMTAAMRHQFEQDEAKLKEAVSRGLITPEEAEKRAKEAAKGFNRGVLSTIDRLRADGNLNGTSGQGVFKGLTDQLKNVGSVATGMGAGIKEAFRGFIGPLVAFFAVDRIIEFGKAVTEAAMKVDSMTRVIQNRIPGAENSLRELTNTMNAFRIESGLTREEAYATANAITRSGVSGIEEFKQRLELSAKVAKAAGEDYGMVAEGIDQVGDAFGLTGSKLEETIAQIYTLTKGRTDLQSIFRVLQRGGSVLQTFGVDATQAAGAMAAFIDTGVPARQAGTLTTQVIESLSNAMGQEKLVKEARAAGIELTALGVKNKGLIPFLVDMATKLGNNTESLQNLGFTAEQVSAITKLTSETGLRAIRDASISGKEATDKLNQSFENIEGSAEEATKKLHSKLSVELEHIGTTLLPVVVGGLSGLNDMLRVLFHTSPGTTWESTKKELEYLYDLAKNIPTILQGNYSPFSSDRLARKVSGVQSGASSALQGVVSGASGAGSATGTPPKLPPAPKIRSPEEIAAEEAAAKERIAKAKQVAAERLQIEQQLQQQIVSLTVTAVDDLELTLTRLEAQVKKAFGTNPPKEFAAAVAGLKEQIATAKFTEGFDREFGKVQEKVQQAQRMLQQGTAQGVAELMPTLNAMTAQLQTQQDSVKKGSKAWEEYDKRLKAVDVLIRQLVSGLGDASVGIGETQTATEKWLEHLQNVVTQVTNIVNGIAGIADGLGLVDQNLRSAIQGATQLANALPKALTGDPSSIIAAIGGAVQLVGGLFGDSPEEKARKQAIKDNTDAIYELSHSLRDADLTGSQQENLERVVQTVNQMLAQHPQLGSHPDLIQAGLINRGFNLKQLTDEAKELGITLVFTTQGMKQLSEALGISATASYAETYAGQLEKLNDEFAILDITDPVKQLQAFQKTLNGLHVPALSALSQIDVSTEEGRAAAKREMQQLLAEFEKGIDRSALGDMTSDEFLQTLRDMDKYLEAAAEEQAKANDPYAAQAVAVNESITRVEALRLDSQLTTSNVWLSRIAGFTSVLPQLVSGNRLMANGLSVTFADGAIKIGETVPTAVVRDDLVKAVDTGLGAALAKKALAAGNVVMQ
jgi:TP901 family phage tail tape measure protein